MHKKYYFIIFFLILPVATARTTFTPDDWQIDVLKQMYGDPLPYNVTYYNDGLLLDTLELVESTGIALCDTVYIKKNYFDNTPSLAHEYMHIIQQQKVGCLKLIWKGLIKQGTLITKYGNASAMYFYNLSDPVENYNEEQEAGIADQYIRFLVSGNKTAEYPITCVDCKNFTQEDRFIKVKGYFEAIKMKYS